MSPAPLSPLAKMSHPTRTSSQDSDSIRKRVCKACDRCRMKKSKCDGSSPCSRCKADNAICVFGERKKTHDKVYPKGYVEMLEQQQSQLVVALQEMYRRSCAGQEWSGPALPEVNGNPLTHDILASLNLLETKNDGTGEAEGFEEDTQKLQSRLLAEGVGYMQQRRSSFSSDSEHSQHGHGPARSASNSTSNDHKRPVFKENFVFPSHSPSPLPQSPAAGQRQPLSRPQPRQVRQYSPITPNDPLMYQPEWSLPDLSSPEMIKTRFALQTPALNQPIPDVDQMFGNDQFDMGYEQSYLPVTSPYYQQFAHAYGGNMPPILDLDPMDLDMSKYVQVRASEHMSAGEWESA